MTITPDRATDIFLPFLGRLISPEVIREIEKAFEKESVVKVAVATAFDDGSVRVLLYSPDDTVNKVWFQLVDREDKVADA